MTRLFKVSGCGITAICQRGESMLWIIRMIIYKGGVPDIEAWTEGAAS